MNVIELIPANKATLVSHLKDLLAGEDTFDFSQISYFNSVLLNSVHFLIETPYTDAHYRDSYYFYFVEKFKSYGRNTVRVHIFSEEVNENNFRDKEKDYLGYFIVRPLNSRPLGHSFVSPVAFKNKNFLCCLTRTKVSVLGTNFEICAFPHVAQDSETQTCAESSLWSILNYFGTKYNDYKPYNPSEIIEKLNSFSGHRMLPSKGLSVHEISSFLNSCEQRCIVYTDRDNLGDKFFAIMQIYIESGMPFVVALTNKKLGHAALAIGHENIDFAVTVDALSKIKSSWNDISFVSKRLVFIDDNFPPYVMDTCSSVAVRYNGTKLDGVHVSAFIVPLQKHMYMDALDAYDLMYGVLSHPIYGLSKFSKEKWITRLFLTKSRSFKNKILSDKLLDNSLKEMLLAMALPKFVWVCEIFTAQSYKDGECKGILILDSTGRSDSVSSVLLYYVDNFSIEHNGLGFTKTSILEKCFSKEIYINNLSGEWNSWKD